MPITVTENAGLRKIEVLIQKVSDRSMLELCESLANALVEELHTVPWGGNIKRGLTHRSSPRKTSTGGWAIGIGSLNILHRQPAPQGTISAFLKWYRERAEEQRRRTVAQAREAKGQRAATVKETKKAFRRSFFEQLRIERLRDSTGITRAIAQRDMALEEQFERAEKKLGKLLEPSEYEKYMIRYDKIMQAEIERRRRKYG